MREVITSTVVIASSTSRPRAMISAPSEMRCRSIPMNSMIGKIIATVSGIDKATTAPGRNPRLTMLQAMMMAMACQRDSMNSPMAFFTTTGWSDTKVTSMPIGRSAMPESIALFTLLPNDRMSPPSRMAMARPMAGLPLTRNIGCGGSDSERRTSAMSRNRIKRPFDTKLTSSKSFSDLKAPVTRIDNFSLPVWSEPAGITAFCAWSAAISAVRSTPRPASWRVENLDLGNVRNLQKLRAHVLDIIAQRPMAEAVSGERVNKAICVAEIIVEAGADDALRQGPAYIADVLAHLIPDVRHLPCRGRAFEGDENRRQARAGIRAQEIQALRFLQLALKAFGDLSQGIVERCPRPSRLHDHGTESKGRVFAASQAVVGRQAGDHDRDHCKNDKGSMF